MQLLQSWGYCRHAGSRCGHQRSGCSSTCDSLRTAARTSYTTQLSLRAGVKTGNSHPSRLLVLNAVVPPTAVVAPAAGVAAGVVYTGVPMPNPPTDDPVLSGTPPVTSDVPVFINPPVRPVRPPKRSNCACTALHAHSSSRHRHLDRAPCILCLAISLDKIWHPLGAGSDAICCC
jgi:hypothetical protein